MVANLHIRTREEVFFLNKTTGAGMVEVFCILFMGNTRTGKNYAGGLVRGHSSREGIF